VMQAVESGFADRDHGCGSFKRLPGPAKFTPCGIAALSFRLGWTGVIVEIIPRYILRPRGSQLRLQ
jgi:hypothetical protein